MLNIFICKLIEQNSGNILSNHFVSTLECILGGKLILFYFLLKYKFQAWLVLHYLEKAHCEMSWKIVSSLDSVSFSLCDLGEAIKLF